jgi:hypothetical protein
MSSHRQAVLTILETFDKPQLAPNCVQRPTANVVQQALLLSNSEEVRGWSEQFARRVLREAGEDPRDQVERAWTWALSRPPDDEEADWALALLGELRTHWASHLAEQDPEGSAGTDATILPALTGLCHTLLNSAEFLYVD